MNWQLKCALILMLQFKLTLTQDCLQPAEGVQIPVEDINGPRLPSGTQAIVTSYQFNCCGDISAWEAAVFPNGANHARGAYTIRFQVWRPSPTVETDGCYSLVGENRFSRITLVDDLVRETPEPSNIISVQPGDVVGYFATSTEGSDNGIQLHEELLTGETVWYHTNTEMEPLIPSGAESCPFPVGPESDRILRSSTNLGPIVSVLFSISDCPTLQTAPNPSHVISTHIGLTSTSTNVPFTTTAISSTPLISQSPAGSGVGLTIGVCVLVVLVVTLVVLVTAIAIYRRKTAGKTTTKDRGDTLQTKDNVAYIPNTNTLSAIKAMYPLFFCPFYMHV